MQQIIPQIGLGTFRLQGQIVKDSVQQALQAGYRAIDTAQIYDNETAIGEAIQASKISAQQLFLTTKIWTENLRADRLIVSLKESLHKLKQERVNLTLIHWPAPQLGISVAEMMENLLAAKQAGLTEHIGVSNFNIDLTQQAIDSIGLEQIATNQIELSPYLQNQKLVDFLNQHQIQVSSYMTLAYGKVLNDPVLHTIAQRHQATTAQVSLAWALQLDHCVIPSSTKMLHLRENLAARQLKLSPEEMQLISQLERDGREVNPEHLAPHWD